MPLTLPSHAAAILPLTRVRALPPSALVLGAAAPDLGYLLKLPGSHSWGGLLPVIVPAGLLLWLWAEWLLLPMLREVLPPIGTLHPARLLATRGAPLRPGALLAASIAIVCGASTHLLWDGFTHDRLWPASQLYPSEHFGLPFGLTVARVLQHLSTVLGAVLVLRAWGRAARRGPLAEPKDPAVTRTGDLRAAGLLVLGVLAAAALQGARELRWTHPETSRSLLLWMGFWAAARGALVMLSVAGLLAWWRRRRARLSGRPAMEEPPQAA